MMSRRFGGASGERNLGIVFRLRRGRLKNSTGHSVTLTGTTLVAAARAIAEFALSVRTASPWQSHCPDPRPDGAISALRRSREEVTSRP